MVGRQSHFAGDLGLGFLRPRRIAADRSEHGAALLPMRWLELLNELHHSLRGRLLHAEWTAIGKETIDSRRTVAVAQLGIERDDFIPGRLEVRKILPGQLEFDLGSVGHAASPD